MFCPVVSSIFYLFSSPILSCHRLDVYHTSAPDVALVQIKDAGLKRAARGSLEMQDPKNRQKFAICAPSHNSVGPYLRQLRDILTIGKKIVKQQHLLHMSSQYGELWPTNG